MKMRARGKGTKEEPNIVDAMDTFRMVGCHCNAEDTTIKYFWKRKNMCKTLKSEMSEK